MKKYLKISVGLIFILLIVYIAYSLYLKYLVKVPFNEENLIPVENYYSDTISNDEACIIDNEYEAYQIRFKLLDEAKEDLKVTYFAIQDDEIGNDFLAKILEAANRGVKVEVLVDSFSTHAAKGLAVLAGNENIIVKEYNKFNALKPSTFHERMHDKYMIVDNTYLLLGGRNIGQKYLGNSPVTKDKDVLIKRIRKDDISVIDDVSNYQAQVFNYKYTTPIKYKNSDVLDNRLENLESRYHYKDFDLDYKLKPTNKITLLSNPIIKDKKEPILLKNLTNLANSSKDYLLVQTPYLVLDKNIKQVFDTKAKIELQTNSLYSTPNIPAFSNYIYNKDKILDRGITIYEYNSIDSLHQKAMLVDDRITVVGSFNMDPRSSYIDTELMLVIDSKEVQDQFKAQNELYLNNSVTYTNDDVIGVPLKVSKAKKFLFKTAGILLSPFKSLL